jgi:hypothetical protein
LSSPARAGWDPASSDVVTFRQAPRAAGDPIAASAEVYTHVLSDETELDYPALLI